MKLSASTTFLLYCLLNIVENYTNAQIQLWGPFSALARTCLERIHPIAVLGFKSPGLIAKGFYLLLSSMTLVFSPLVTGIEGWFYRMLQNTLCN